VDTSIKNILVLYRQHLYQQVIAACEAYPTTGLYFHNTQLLKLNALYAAALFQQAFQFSEALLDAETKDRQWQTRFRLWHRLLLIYDTQPSDLRPTLAYFEQVAQGIDTDAYTQGLAHDLSGRTLQLGITQQLLSAIEYKAQAVTHWQQAASYYHHEQAYDDYVGVLKMLAHLQESPPLADEWQARVTYQQLLAFGTDNDFAIANAEARLAIAEKDFKQLNNSAQPVEPKEEQRIRTDFSEIEELFRHAGCTWGSARVQESLGSTLLRYGRPDGEPILREAIRRYQQGDFPIDQQRVYRLLLHWYRIRGESEGVRKASQTIIALNSQYEFRFSHQTEQLKTAVQAYQNGQFGESKLGYDEALCDPGVTWNRTEYMNLKVRRLDRLQQKSKVEAAQLVVEWLRPTGPTAALAEALVQWAGLKFGEPTNSSYEQASSAMQEAITLDATLGLDRTLAAHLLLFSHYVVEWLRLVEIPVAITAEIKAYWDQAQQLLAVDKTHEGIIEYGKFFAFTGQQCFLASQFEETKQRFQEAEGLLLLADAKPELVFLYAQQGLLEMQIASHNRSQQGFLTALQTFERAEALLVHMESSDIAWRISYHRGNCLRIIGQFEQNTLQQEQWRTQADEAYEAAHRLLFSLMLVADYQVGDSQHSSRAGFLADCQTVYEQGFLLNLRDWNRPLRALQWLDRMKNQVLLATVHEQATPHASGSLEPVALDINWDALHQKLLSLATALQRRVAVFTYYFTPRYQYVICLSSDSATLQVDSLSIDFEAFQQLREIVFQTPGGVSQMKENGTDHSWAKHSGLIGPVERRTSPGDVVLLVPHGLLHGIPLHTLRTTENAYLIERNPVGYQLSLALLLRSPIGTFSHTAVQNQVFGDSGANSKHALEGAAKEARFAAWRLHTKPYLGSEATRERFLQAFTTANIIHFAGHGKFVLQEGLDQHLLLANNEKVSAGDLIRLKSPASLIVLSGCETGLSEYRTGDELFGLVRALLSAGVATVIASQWEIDDEVTAPFFLYFYERPLTGVPGEKLLALQQATVRMIQQGHSMYEWGSFTLTGTL
jgi:CHAT domain-containing protein